MDWRYMEDPILWEKCKERARREMEIDENLGLPTGTTKLPEITKPTKPMFDFLKRKKKEPKKASDYYPHSTPSSNPTDPTSPLYWSMIHSASSDSDRPCGGSGSHSDHNSCGGSSHDAGTASGYDGGSSSSCGASCGSSGGGGE